MYLHAFIEQFLSEEVLRQLEQRRDPSADPALRTHVPSEWADFFRGRNFWIRLHSGA